MVITIAHAATLHNASTDDNADYDSANNTNYIAQECTKATTPLREENALNAIRFPGVVKEVCLMKKYVGSATRRTL